MKKLIILSALSALFLSSANAKSDPIQPEFAIEDSVAKKEPKIPNYKIIGLAQLHFADDESNQTNSNFLIRRLRLGVEGKINNNINYNFLVGAVETQKRNPQIVNAFLDFNHISRFKIRVGQFFVPFGLEGRQPIFINPAIERSTATIRLNTFNLFRDVGVGFSDGGELGNFEYSAAVVSGEGANQAENNNSQDVVGRVGFKAPFGLNVGASGHQGTFVAGSKSLDRFRYALDFEYLISRWQVRGEYIARSDQKIDKSDLDSWGWYLLAGYDITKNVVGIVRYEQYQSDIDLNNNIFSAATFGLSYVFSKNNRISLNYEFRDDDSNKNIDDRLTAQLQIAL